MEPEHAKAKTLSIWVNSTLLLFVLCMMGFFWMLHVDFLVYFSIPTTLVYVIGYFLIFKDKLHIYVRMVYFWITFYMGVTTVCLGYSYGFYLYCFSLMPTVFVTEYLAYKLKNPRLHPIVASSIIAAICLGSTLYVLLFGSVYDLGGRFVPIFWTFNLLSVVGFIISYCQYLIKAIIRSEKQLIEIAHVDRLTGLYNRHYMLGRLESLPESPDSGFIAMADIDHFKHINDTYGHNAGDEVLRAVSAAMQKACTGCEVARWGGEEFLILSPAPVRDGIEMLEAMRQQIAATPVTLDTQTICVTITIGIAPREPGQSIDAWIHSVDQKLYTGKNAGRNTLIA